GDVGGDADGRAAVRTNLRGHALGTLPVQIRHRDLRPLGREAPRDRPSDPGPAARHDRHAPGEQSHEAAVYNSPPKKSTSRGRTADLRYPSAALVSTRRGVPGCFFA